MLAVLRTTNGPLFARPQYYNTHTYLILLQQLSNSSSIFRINLSEIPDSSLLDKVSCILQVASNIINQSNLFILCQNLTPKNCHLNISNHNNYYYGEIEMVNT